MHPLEILKKEFWLSPAKLASKWLEKNNEISTLKEFRYFFLTRPSHPSSLVLAGNCGCAFIGKHDIMILAIYIGFRWVVIGVR